MEDIIRFMVRWLIRLGLLVFLIYIFIGTNFGVRFVKIVTPDMVLEKVDWAVNKVDEYLPTVKERVAKLLEKEENNEKSNKAVKDATKKVVPGKADIPKPETSTENANQKIKTPLSDSKLAKEVGALRKELAILKADLATMMYYQSRMADIERRVLKTEAYPNAEALIQNLEAITYNLDKRLKAFAEKK